MSGIRIADIPDLDEICVLAKELSEQSIYTNIKIDESKLKMFCASLMGSKNGTVLLVVDKDNKPQGFLLGGVEELFYSKQKMATDYAVFVRIGYRHSAKKLFDTFTKWAENKTGLAQITLGISSGIGDPERTGKLYQSLGFERVGGIFVKLIKRV